MERQHLKKMLSVHSLTQLKPNFEKNLKSIKTDIRKNNELLTPQNDNENMNNMYKDKSIRNKFIESHRKMLYNLNITFESQKSSLNIKNTHNQELEIAKEKQKLKLFGIISKFKKVIII